MSKIAPNIKNIVKQTDRWKCQCLMIESLALWMDDHQLFQKSLQILATIVSFLTLALSILSIQGKSQILIYQPFGRHYLLSSLQNISSYEFLKQQCHHFGSLAHVKFVGFDRLIFYQVRIVILFVLWVVDMLGLFFSFVHPPCGTKMYVFGLIITLLFFVMFPSELCINFGNECIQYSPIFFFYRIEFMIKFNVALLGMGSIGLILVIFPINYLASQHCNIYWIGNTFFETIYWIASIPFFIIATINFITALWTSSAIINTLTLASTVINYLLYHASTTLRQQIHERKRAMEKIRQNLPKNEEDCEFYMKQMLVEDTVKSEIMNSVDKLENFKQSQFVSPQKPDRMQFYREWQNRLQKQFYET